MTVVSGDTAALTVKDRPAIDPDGQTMPVNALSAILETFENVEVVEDQGDLCYYTMGPGLRGSLLGSVEGG